MKKLNMATALVLAACGSSPPPERKTIQNGSWQGTAFDSTDVIFTVNDGQIQNMAFQITYDMASQPDTTVSWSFETEITDDQFQYMQITGEISWESGLNITGTFDPPDHVSGSITTWAVFTQGGGTETDTLEATWSAAPE